MTAAGMNEIPISDEWNIGLDSLIATRLLIQANSGGGKSYALRRLLEQSHGKVQQLVIDPEGEFATLRERFDYVLAAHHGGDTSASPRIAPLLAERLLELQASAILDLFELKPHERIAFVQRFLNALVNAPKSLWHPVLVVIDEAHQFCPEKGEAESKGAVIDVTTLGRKRGFCAVLATQRLSKLNKDAAAECNNKLIGRTGLDVDVKRAADELGFGKDRWRELRQLDEGYFFAFGPSISREVVSFRVGPVTTTHPKAGARIALTPPPARANVKALLPKLADLPAEADQREKSIEDLKRENAQLRRDLAAAKKAQPAAPPPPKPIEVPVLKPIELREIQKACAAAESLDERMKALHDTLSDRLAPLSMVIPAKPPGVRGRGESGRPAGPGEPARTGGGVAPVRSPVPAAPPRTNGEAPTGISGPARRILSALAELEMLGVARAPRIQVALFAGYTNLSSKGFANSISELRSAGLIDYPSTGEVSLTEFGREVASAPDAPRTDDEIHERVIGLIGGASARVLRPLIDAYPKRMSRDDLMAAAGYGNASSKGFANTVSRLRSLGLIDYPASGEVVATAVLFVRGES